MIKNKKLITHTNTKINRKEERKNSYFFKNVYFFFRLTYFEISTCRFLTFIIHSSDDNNPSELSCKQVLGQDLGYRNVSRS